MAAIRKIIIPSLWPAIIAGMTLVVFETIADFGGVSTLRVETFTVGIYVHGLDIKATFQLRDLQDIF